MKDDISIYIEQAIKSVTSKEPMDFNMNNMISNIGQKIGDFFGIPNITQINTDTIVEFFSKLGTAFVIICISFIILYILKSFALYKIMKNHNKSNAWISFIPYGCLYSIGKIIGKTKLFGIEISNTYFVLPLILITGNLPLCGFLSTILFILCFYGLLFRLYEKLTPNFAIVLLLLSILVPFLFPVFLFVLRKN